MADMNRNLPDGSQYIVTATHRSFVEHHKVSDVGGDGEEKIIRALEQASNLPLIGSQHPRRTGFFCEQIRVSPSTGDTDSFDIYVHWSTGSNNNRDPKEEQKGLFQFGASVHTVQTTDDHKGDKIEVTYTLKDKDGNEKKDTQNGVVDIDFPIVEFSLTRFEKDFSVRRAIMYAGKINSGSFQGCGKHTVRCVGVDTTLEQYNEDGDLIVEASWRFQYHEHTWNPTVYWRDPKTGEPPEDLVDGKGKKQVQVYKDVDFNALKLR